MTYFRMMMCRNSEDQDIRGTFATVADGEAWIEENYPGWLDGAKRLWESPDRGPDGYKQYGMNHHWVSFEPFAGGLPISSATLVPDEVDKGGPPN